MLIQSAQYVQGGRAVYVIDVVKDLQERNAE